VLAWDGMLFGSFLLLWVVMMVVIVGGLVLWIVTLVEVVQQPDHAFRAAGTEKLTWGLVVGLTGWIGALIWLLGPRQRVKAAAASPAPPGWYPTAEGPRYFDGFRWFPMAPYGPAPPPDQSLRS
jgi:hypothetical protein